MTFICPSTVAGWLWYCDNHDTHGNADTQDEAQAYAEAHREHFADDQADDPCDVIVWLRTPHERSADATTPSDP
jgi:hypothetical protein